MASTQNQKSGTTNPGDIFGSSMSLIPLGVAYRIYDHELPQLFV
jgi:hypothetical protein